MGRDDAATAGAVAGRTSSTGSASRRSSGSVEDGHGLFKWVLPDLRGLKGKVFSPTFKVGGHEWRLMVCIVEKTSELSLFLDSSLAAATQAKGWHRTAHFTLKVVNLVNPARSLCHDAKHIFVAEEPDWGFSNFCRLQTLLKSDSGYLDENGGVHLECEIQVIKHWNSDQYINWYNYDSKKETGFVGLRNQGATCYMNSLLQVLFHLGFFRKAVYRMPTHEEKEPAKSIPYALQKLFFFMQVQDRAPGTKVLTKAFGWDSLDAFTQHDVQEFNRVLMDNLEEKMKKTEVEGTINKLFEGKLKNYIECINVNYESSRTEAFYDISLNVKGFKTIYDSLKDYVAIETLDGDNKYMAEGFGLQPARKGCWFLDLPPVLEVQLKRFEYDPMRDAMVKVNDRYEFTPELDMSKYMAPDFVSSYDLIYDLYAVLVHSGDTYGGHYYAFVRPSDSYQWYKFDDDKVTKVTADEAIEQNFGGDDDYGYTLGGRRFTSVARRASNAYMLVYVRRGERETILQPLTEEHIPRDLRDRLERDKAEQLARIKDRQEAHLYCQLKIATDDDLKAHRGFDLVSFDNVATFKVKKVSLLKDLRLKMAEHWKVEPHRMRLWTWVGRQNHTMRPDLPIMPSDDQRTIGEVLRNVDVTTLSVEFSKAPKNEVAYDKLFPPSNPHVRAHLMLKVFSPETKTLQYLCDTFAPFSARFADLAGKFAALAGWDERTPILMFEEIKPSMIEEVKPSLTLTQAEIGHGDIICIQKAPTGEAAKAAFPTVDKYFDYLVNRQVVKFRRLDKPKENAFELELSKKMRYSTVTERVAKAVGAKDATYIRLTGHNSFYESPKSSPIKSTEKPLLKEMLMSYYQSPVDILYFEVLDEPITEIENKKILTVSWHNSKTEEVKEHKVMLPKTANVADLLARMKELVTIEGSGRIRLMEVIQSKIHYIHSDANEPITNLSEYTTLRCEEITEEELNKKADEKRIQVVHFTREAHYLSYHGHPFFMILRPDEPFSETKKRIKKRLGIKDSDWAKWKFALTTTAYSSPNYLEDSDIVHARDIKGACLGLEHPDTLPRKSRFHMPQKAIKIYN